jgi:hypothetical protein
MDKINRLAENLGINEPGEAEGQGADLAGSPDFMDERTGLTRPIGEVEARPRFFLLQTAVTH